MKCGLIVSYCGGKPCVFSEVLGKWSFRNVSTFRILKGTIAGTVLVQFQLHQGNSAISLSCLYWYIARVSFKNKSADVYIIQTSHSNS